MILALSSGLITHMQEAGRGKQSDLPIFKSTEDQGKVVGHRHEDLEEFQNRKKKNTVGILEDWVTTKKNSQKANNIM